MKRISIYDVAKNLNISASTVSRVLNNDKRISEATRKKVLQELKRIKYMPNQYAKNLKNMENKNIGIFYTNHVHEKITPIHMNEKICGICSEIEKAGYNASLFIRDYKEEDIWDIVMKNNLCGILSLDRFDIEMSKNIMEYKIPHVQVNWHNDALPPDSYVSVENDAGQAIHILLEHLYQQGYREIEVLYHHDTPLNDERAFHAIDSFKKGKKDISIIVTKSEIDFINPQKKEYQKQLQRHLEQGLKRAYLCTYYEHAYWLLDFAMKKGLRIPDDIAVVTQNYDDIFSLFHPIMTGTKQLLYEIGSMAAKKLLSVIQGNQETTVFVTPELYIGESS